MSDERSHLPHVCPPSFDSFEWFSMSCLARVVNRGDKFDDTGCANKWKWDWISVEVEVKIGEVVKKERIGSRFRKVNVSGAAWCVLCNTDVSYASRGVATLRDHLRTKKHLDKCASLEQNQRLPGELDLENW